MLEKKVYSGWAFTCNENEKSTINWEIYNEIKDKAKVKYIKSTFGNSYKIIENNENLTMDELALICDDGNLCFGYTVEKDGVIRIFTD